ncbi:phytoene desaturase family protein [Leisingera sp. ANG-M7]|uniref:phytoene desaturase family protein n=1 Tax=Leisingera sp. ANG-M7 TaxID=1577902 RepID=UPI00069049D5|nr:NAD(P)-binding protein [Leisingera sp. ANG-M7]
MGQHDRYDAIVAGAGHNGLTATCYLAKAGLKVLEVEGNDWFGGAAVSRSLHEGWTCSNCSYVCSLLRREIVHDLELPKYGLQVIPYEVGASFSRDGGYFAYMSDHDALRREISRHGAHDADAYDRFSRTVIRRCRFIRPFLLRNAPDSTSLNPRDIGELLFLIKQAHRQSKKELGETLRFWSMSISDFRIEHFENDLIKAGFIAAGFDFQPVHAAMRLGRGRSPLELELELGLGLGFAKMVDFSKGHFNGRRALLDQQKNGLRYHLRKIGIGGFKPADGALIYNKKKKEVGHVTSGVGPPPPSATSRWPSSRRLWAGASPMTSGPKFTSTRKADGSGAWCRSPSKISPFSTMTGRG